MAERRPDLAREHRLHDRFRWPPRASPVRFQVSRPADRTSRGWARGTPLAGCRFPGPATRRLGLESVKASAPLPTAARRPCVVVVVAATPNYLRQASQNLGKYTPQYTHELPRARLYKPAAPPALHARTLHELHEGRPPPAVPRSRGSAPCVHMCVPTVCVSVCVTRPTRPWAHGPHDRVRATPCAQVACALQPEKVRSTWLSTTCERSRTIDSARQAVRPFPVASTLSAEEPCWIG